MLKDSMKQYRQDLHQIPEIGLCEFKTSKYIKEKLTSFGYTIESTAQTGVIAYKKGESSESVAFRADMDALSIRENTNLEYKSKLDNYMHACGHDGHMAILLGFAKLVSKIEKCNKGILFIFQPAEEGPGGAKLIVEEGVLEKYNVKQIFGLHLFPNIDQGFIGIKSGPLMAQTGEFDVNIKGSAGHGAMPHNANDALIVASQLITAYQTIISRNINPMEPAVLTMGTIQGGERRNVIAENIKIEGTLRAFDKNIYNIIKNKMININIGLEEMFNVKVDVSFTDMYPAVLNDKNLVKTVVEFLDKNKIVELNAMMLAEDFSYYQEVVPGIFFMLGVRNESLGHTHQLHTSEFNFNEDVLLDGVNLFDTICKGLKVY